jgi:hypothetical protein
VKKITSVIGVILLVVFVFGVIVFESANIQNFIFYKSGLTPKDVFSLNDKINSSSPTDPLAERTPILTEIDNFIKSSIKGGGFSTKAYDLVRIRLDAALTEIPKTVVPKGKVKIWYIYNMGIIAKSDTTTVAFDLAGTYAYTKMVNFAKYVDVLAITHFDGDHFDLAVVKEVLKNGGTVIIPGDKMLFKGLEFGRDPGGVDAVDLIKQRNGINSNNLVSLESYKAAMVKGVEITAYPAIHIHNPEEENSFTNPPVNCYFVNLSGFKIVHTGDAESVINPGAFPNTNIDLFVFHSTTIDPRTNQSLMKLVPDAKTTLPLHVLELGHGSRIMNKNDIWYMNYQSILDNYANGYYKSASGRTNFMPLIWGESFEL